MNVSDPDSQQFRLPAGVGARDREEGRSQAVGGRSGGQSDDLGDEFGESFVDDQSIVNLRLHSLGHCASLGDLIGSPFSIH